jgi:hypothetical protein
MGQGFDYINVPTDKDGCRPSTPARSPQNLHIY